MNEKQREIVLKVGRALLNLRVLDAEALSLKTACVNELEELLKGAENENGTNSQS